jgi:hypothetical protein
MLSDEDPSCRAFAAYMLYADVTIGREVPIDRMVEALAHPRPEDDPFERTQLVETLFQMGTRAQAARGVLKQVAEEAGSDPALAKRAREAIMRIDGRE